MEPTLKHHIVKVKACHYQRLENRYRLRKGKANFLITHVQYNKGNTGVYNVTLTHRFFSISQVFIANFPKCRSRGK